MPWQAAAPGTIAQEAQGTYHIKVGGNWVAAPKGSIATDDQGTYHFNDDTLTAPPAAPAAQKTPAAEPNPAGETAKKIVGSMIPFAPAIENLVSGVTGGIGSLLDAVTGAAPGTHNIAYQPRTPGGKAIQSATGAVAGPAIHALSQGIANTGLDSQDMGGSAQNALADTLEERIPEALGAVGTVAG